MPSREMAAEGMNVNRRKEQNNSHVLELEGKRG